MKTTKILMMLLMFMVALSCGPDDEAKNNVPVIKAQAYSAKENITLETVIGTVAASDADEDALTFSIATNDNNLFAIAKDGKLSLAQGKSLDFKSSEVHTIKVAVSDEEDTASANIIINVIDVPNNAPEVAEDEISFDAAEDITAIAVIGEVQATDEDEDDLTFAITEDESELFEIIKVEGAGVLSLGAGKSLDFETSQSHTVIVGVSDGEATTFVTITINVTDVDDDLIVANNKPVIETDSFTAAENITAAEVIGTVVATDEDGDDLTFTITEDSSALFEITTGGELSLAAGKTLDFEGSDSHSITVSVSDGTDTVEKQITINVTNVNKAPVIGNPKSFEVEENIADDYVIGTVVATDEDGDGFTFAITEDSSALFEITNGGELSLVAGKILDYESSPNYAIKITVNDGEGLSTEATITINVINIVDLAEKSTSFITVWQTTMPNEEVVIGTSGSDDSDFNYIIDWGDGTVQELNNSNPSHTYEIAGTYTVAIEGQFPGFGTEDEGTFQCIRMEQWGNIEWKDLSYAFRDYEMAYNATDTPNLSQVEGVEYMFGPGTLFNNGSIADWDVSQIERMSYMFRGVTNFNQDISGWVVSSATNMEGMFMQATNFNQDISGWEVGNVDYMRVMFLNATTFNQPIGNWGEKVSNVTDMVAMFSGATNFNQDISGWDVGNVNNMNHMFVNASSFDQNLGGWNISNISNMTSMLDNSGLSTGNYSNTLIGWATIVGQETIPQNINLGALGLEYYCENQEVINARSVLSLNPYGWSFVGDTQANCN